MKNNWYFDINKSLPILFKNIRYTPTTTEQHVHAHLWLY